MAKRSSSKKASKHYPVQRTIEMGRPLPSTPDTFFVLRGDKLLSHINHRLYRQSRVYRCKIEIDADLADGQGLVVSAIADTWFNQKAYQLAKKMFDENSAEERAQLGKSAARWNDFRVDHGTVVDSELFATRLAYLDVGEYQFSEVADTLGVSNTFRWSGNASNTFNIIDEYDATGNTDASPSTPTGSVAYDGLTDELDDNQMDHISNDGNNPPYQNSTFTNNAFEEVSRLYTRASGTSKLTTGYFDAPCGLILISTFGGLEANTLTGKIKITFKDGDYKGVHAPSYLE